MKQTKFKNQMNKPRIKIISITLTIKAPNQKNSVQWFPNYVFLRVLSSTDTQLAILCLAFLFWFIYIVPVIHFQRPLENFHISEFKYSYIARIKALE